MNEGLKARRCLKRKIMQHWFMQVWGTLFTGSRSRDSYVGIATCYGLDGPGSNPDGGEIFRIRPDRLWGPPSLLYNGCRVFSRGKAAGAWRWSPTPSSAEVKEGVELYLYSPSGPSWPVLGWTLPLPLPIRRVYRKVITEQTGRLKINGLKICNVIRITTWWTRVKLLQFVAKNMWIHSPRGSLLAPEIGYRFYLESP